MPINAHPDYLAAEAEYHKAQTLEERIKCLEKMISLAPGHKGAENLRAQLRTRLKKFKEQKEKSKKSGKTNIVGIKKHDMQAVIIGKKNSGKSSLLKFLTNAEPVISPIEMTTVEPAIGMMPFAGTQVQLIENPSIDSEYYDKGLTNTADTLILIIKSLEEIKELEDNLEKAPGKRIVLFNKNAELKSNDERKIIATLKSKFKKYKFLISNLSDIKNEKEIKETIFNSFDKIRVFTKEPGKEKSNNPLILEPESTVKDVAEKILKGLSKRVKQTRIWGPSSKFGGQVVGLNHKLKDLDVVEFKTV